MAASTPAAETTSPPPRATPSGAAPAAPSRQAGDCPVQACVDVVVTGDVLLHPPLWRQAAADGGGMDFAPLLAGLRPYLAEAELAICALETPVGKPSGPFSGYPSFNVPPQILPALKATGYDACTTATNHSVDAGTAGVVRTLDALDAVGLAHTGTYRSRAEAEQPLIVRAGEARVAIITATFGLNGLRADAPWRVDLLDTADMISRARDARKAGADIVLGNFHAGDEYSTRPNAAQVGLAHRLAESGEFDFIYGHHTHSVLPLEQHDGVWIAYGLGNSVSEHATRRAVNREGLTVALRFTRSGGTWKAEDPRWAGHIMARDPARWCALPAATPCTTAAEDAASLQRTAATVNALGADDDGARRWSPGAP